MRILLDENLSYQQNLVNHAIAVIVLRAASNRLADTLHLMPKVLECLSDLRTGEVVRVE